VRRRSWQARRDPPAWRAEANAAHRALAELASSAIDTRIITQNIDGLHQKAGTPAERVIEVHGTMFGVVCVSCGDRSPMAGALSRIEAGEEDPDCPRCGGILKSATVMFGQPLDPGVFARAERACCSARSACSTRATRMSRAEARCRASHSTTGTWGSRSSADLTSSVW